MQTRISPAPKSLPQVRVGSEYIDETQEDATPRGPMHIHLYGFHKGCPTARGTPLVDFIRVCQKKYASMDIVL